MNGRPRWLSCLAVCCAAFALSASAAEPQRPDYLAVVQRYADAMIRDGRDTYGNERTPMFATTLDRKTLKLFEGDALEKVRSIGRGGWGIRPSDRSVEGANPMHHQNLYQVLYALTKVTGRRIYEAEADAALTCFFRRCQSPTTGLLCWGEHLGWNFLTESRIRQHGGAGTHEFYRPWVLWDRSLTLVPDACDTFAKGLWRHQIADRETGDFSRHAAYDRHGPGRSSQYPRHGGFYILTWAAAYAKTKNSEYLEAIECLVDGFDARRSPKTGALPAETHPRSKGKMVWPPSNLSLAIDLHTSADKVPDPLARKVRACAAKSDAVFLKLGHDLETEGKGFVKAANTDTLASTKWGKGAYSHVWATAYGDTTHADFAMMCLDRYEQVKLDGYRKLALDTAQRYLTSEPDTTIALHPGVPGQVVLLLLRAHRLTGEKRYLDRADHFARIVVPLFWDRSSPLPRATTQHDHYEAITRADTLALALLHLWAAQNKPDLDLPFANCER